MVLAQGVEVFWWHLVMRESWVIVSILQGNRRKYCLSLRSYVLKMLFKWLRCKVMHLIVRISALKWSLSVRNEKRECYSMVLGNRGITVIQHKHSVMVKTKSRMYQLIWSCGVRKLLINLIIQSSCEMVSTIPITCTQEIWDHCRTNTESRSKEWRYYHTKSK